MCRFVSVGYKKQVKLPGETSCEFVRDVHKSTTASEFQKRTDDVRVAEFARRLTVIARASQPFRGFGRVLFPVRVNRKLMLIG